jgi:hypothetical protein
LRGLVSSGNSPSGQPAWIPRFALVRTMVSDACHFLAPAGGFWRDPLPVKEVANRRGVIPRSGLSIEEVIVIQQGQVFALAGLGPHVQLVQRTRGCRSASDVS